MAKIYAKNNVAIKPMNPKKETVAFLLNYSKAFYVIKIGKHHHELFAN